ncbi:alpha-E domain-containing protein [Cumulibacter manganitolerans]|uniref:alpha-E domain-containing protein n=1 Tax=Cumulibacter manganitolerans TaxID=1884992 RepID=UPI001295C29C|nr:alpha-E domain-containing protein [Cumulibacter manganitolerans]
MLSRIAESLFWIGRYIERAESTARILDIHLQLLLEPSEVSEDEACRSLMVVLGSPVEEDLLLTGQHVIDKLTVDPARPGSIAHSLFAARENARRAREIIPSDVWECMNTTQMRMPRRLATEQSHRHFGWVRDRTAMTIGMIEGATSRDETWQFFTLGRALERTDMTARMVATRMLPTRPSWTTILWSCGAYEAYLRTYRGAPKASSAAEFLILDRLFPRSTLYSLRLAEDCLREIDPTVVRAGVNDPAARLVGQLRNQLEYLETDQLAENLHGYVDEIQTAAATISEAIQRRYFQSYAPEWTGDGA